MSTDRIVLAYSGGLDTSVALRWLADEYGAEVIALLVDVGQGIDRELVERRALAGRRQRGRDRGCARGVCPRHGAAGAAGRRAVRGPVPAGLGALAAADRPVHGVDRPRVRRRGGRPRLHRQGQRPGAVRDRGGGARPRPGSAGAGARLGHDPRAGDRLRRAARHRGHGQVGCRLLHRPQPVGPLDRGRPARGSVDRADRGRLRADDGARARAARAAGGHDRVRGRRAGLDRRRGRSTWCR